MQKNIKEKLKKILDKARFNHTLRVEKQALDLARRYKADQNQASLAALLHDCARSLDKKGLLARAKKEGLRIRPIDQKEPKLLHGKLSALIARRKFAIKDPLVLKAIVNHTVGRPKMSKLEKIIFLADHSEAGRKFKGVKRLRRTALKDLNKAVALSCDLTLDYLKRNNLPVDSRTLKTRNYYLELKKK